MSIAGVCPDCGSVRPVTEFLAESRARQALAAALRLDKRLADPVLEYLGLFAPPARKLASNKLVRLLTELSDLVSSGQVSRNHITYPAPVEYWRMGLEEMLARRDRLTLPLKSHGYLMEVVAGIATKAGAKEERQAEEQAATRPRGPGDGLVNVNALVQEAHKKDKGERKGPPAGWRDSLIGSRRGKNTDEQ